MMPPPRSSSNPNLYLVGFMATGKSTVGRMAAEKLGYRFFDSDHQIEGQAGMPIADLFATRGEEEFRRLEREFVLHGHPGRGCVVACGGGLITQDGMIELLKERGVIVCLVASPETILERAGRHGHRPLLNVPDPGKRIRELLAQREPYYREAGPLVLTDNRCRKDIVAHVVRIYLDHARSCSAGSARAPRDESRP